MSVLPNASFTLCPPPPHMAQQHMRPQTHTPTTHTNFFPQGCFRLFHTRTHTHTCTKTHTHKYAERCGAGVETQKNVRGEIGGWGRVPFNETYAPSLSTIYDGA